MDPLVELAIEARALDNRLAKIITPEQATLCVVTDALKITPTELAERMGSASPTVSHAVTALLNKGMIRRTDRSGLNDGRVKPITPTGYGVDVAAHIANTMNNVVGAKRAERAAKALKAIKQANAALAAALD